jgi:rhodanese-related sulfurtransferase
MSTPPEPSAAPTAATPSGETSADPARTPAGAAGDPTEIAVDPAQVAAWLARDPELQLVDVREDYERQAGHIEGSRHIELNQLTAQAATIAPDRPVVFYCRLGSRSDMAAQAFRASGLQAHSLSGGLERWAREGLPLSPADGYVADH